MRSQFRVPIGKFEGVEEALARIGGNTYVMDAARVMTAGAVDLGEKPSVISAIVKYHCTERGRQVINDAMDVHGGKGICLGPNNYLGRAYQQMPIGITVEGANILTRSMIIFGQGAIRCHPYVLKEIAATREPDPAVARARSTTRSGVTCAFVVEQQGARVVAGADRRAAVSRARARPSCGAISGSSRGCRPASRSRPMSRCCSWAATSSAARSSRRGWATS